MNELIAFIEGRLYYYSTMPNANRQMIHTFCDQAFGAVEFYLSIHPEAEAELNKKWISYRTKFYELMAKAAD
jgi:hypothetical protein